MEEIIDMRLKLDENIKGIEKRREIVEDLVGTNFFENYFDNEYKVHLEKDDPLSEDLEVCQLLEDMGTYLIEA